MKNIGCQNCKWASYNEDASMYGWIRDIFHRHVCYPLCSVAYRHPLFKQHRVDHRGVKLTECNNKQLLKAVSKKFEADGRYYTAGDGNDQECLMNKEFTCPFFHRRYTKLSQEQLKELEERLKVEYIL